jgi:outer membrane protein TolC
MNAVWADISKVEKDMEAQSKKISSSESNIKNAETNYADAIKSKADLEKQLQFDVDQLYVAVLNQEAALSIANKEYERELDLLHVEKVRLQLGRSSRQQVDQLADHVAGFERKIIEQAEAVKTKKRQLNDLMGRGDDDELKLVPFDLPETAEVFDYDHLLSKALQQNPGLEKIRRELAQYGDELNDLDREDDYYEYRLKALDIEEKKLQLADEEKKLKERINNLIADLEAKQYAYHLSLISYENAVKVFQLDQKRFEMGLSKLTLRQSELNCLNAQNRKNVAGYAFYLAEAAIRLAEEGIL